MRIARFAFVLMLAVTARDWAVEIKDVPAMPPGIKIADLPNGPVFVTDEGMTIYKYLPPVSTFAYAKRQVEVVGECIYQCPAEFPPLIAPEEAKPVGDFTIVAGPNGVQQWAYKGVPLETFKYDRKPGLALGESTYPFNGPRVPSGEAAWIESEIPPQAPPNVPPTTEIPSGVKVQPGYAGSRYFANLDGFTLYVDDAPPGAHPCAAACLKDWQPFVAPALAKPVGDWAPLTVADGTRQWGYKGKAVYSYLREATGGEVAGDDNDGRWRALVEYQAPLPNEVSIVMTETGAVFAEKATRRTLYYYGLNHRPFEVLGFNHPGLLFGTPTCYNKCAETFPPLLASADAKPVGEWWIVTRVDGAKQWAYRGHPVHTYVKDHPGLHEAADLHNLWTEVVATNRSDK